MNETFGYDSLNRLTSTSVNLSPSPLNKSFTYDLVGNITSKSDVGTYSYPSPGQPLPHGVTSVSGGTINTTFSYDAKGNMTSGNGLTVAYASYNKPASITRGTNTIGFSHDSEHNRYKQVAPGGTTLYLGSGGAMAETFIGSGGAITWTNYLVTSGGLLVGMHVENIGGSTLTRYFHKDHLGSVAVITDESGTVLERLSFDAWGKRRNPNGTDDPAGSITSQTNRGFTGHEELDAVGLVHMNGRVYDPLLARFGTPDPITESPFSTQGWNRYSYVGNSPVNFTDPSGYCFMGCFWKPIFRAIGNFFQRYWGVILQVAATALCVGNPVCAILVSGLTSAFVTGVTSGNLGLALRAGFLSAVTTALFEGINSGFGGEAAGGDRGFAEGSSANGSGLQARGIQVAMNDTTVDYGPTVIFPEHPDDEIPGLRVPTAAPRPSVAGGLGLGDLIPVTGAAASYAMNSNAFRYLGNQPPIVRINSYRGAPPPTRSNGFPKSQIPDGEWVWKNNPGDSRMGRWHLDNYTANYDVEDSHWDVDDSKGNRQRYDNRGNPLTKEEAHEYRGPRLPPLMPRIPTLPTIIVPSPCVIMPDICLGPRI
jgi:RHS repeat-associated protein